MCVCGGGGFKRRPFGGHVIARSLCQRFGFIAPALSQRSLSQSKLSQRSLSQRSLNQRSRILISGFLSPQVFQAERLFECHGAAEHARRGHAKSRNLTRVLHEIAKPNNENLRFSKIPPFFSEPQCLYSSWLPSC